MKKIENSQLTSIPSNRFPNNGETIVKNLDIAHTTKEGTKIGKGDVTLRGYTDTKTITHVYGVQNFTLFW